MAKEQAVKTQVEGLFRELFQHANDAIFLFHEYEFVDCNQQALELFDMPREKLLDHSPIEFSPENQPDGRPSEEKARELLEKALDGTPQRFEWVHERPDGTQFKIEVNLNRIEVNGEYWCQAICRELSYREKYERTRQFLEQTLESTADGILVTDPEGNIEHYNERFLNQWNIPDEVIREEDDDKAVQHVMDQLEHPEEFREKVLELRDNFEDASHDRLQFKDGTILERDSRPLFVNDEPAGRVWSFRDVTERNRRERRLKETRAFLNTIVGEIPLMLVVKDAENFQYEVCNNAVSDFFDMSKQRIEGKTDFDLLPDEQARETRKRDKKVVETGKPLGSRESRLEDMEEDYWLSTRRVPIIDSRGEVQYVLCLTEDITERKQTENELREAQEKLRKLSTTDELTGIRNRRFFNRVFYQSVSKHHRERRPLSVIMFDIDCFKAYNDHYGHPEGDRCLITVAESLESTISRQSDLIARYGGEEFIAMLPETELDGAREVAEQCIQAIRELNIPHEHSDVADYLTISAGVASEIPSQNESSDLVEMADEAMYRSKRKGRDTVTAYDDLPD